jgi:hypothetical protein
MFNIYSTLNQLEDKQIFQNYYIWPFRKEEAIFLGTVNAVATGYGLEVRFRFPTVQDFSFSLKDHIDSEAHPATYPMGTRGKAAGS